MKRCGGLAVTAVPFRKFPMVEKAGKKMQMQMQRVSRARGKHNLAGPTMKARCSKGLVWFRLFIGLAQDRKRNWKWEGSVWLLRTRLDLQSQA